ncbi:MAG: cytochrome b N-terminal domain-containing protein [Anaerolineae bacterium]|nr:cytochrome b N-terminal domain-containing protein [Anaerolineae bacterium]
MISTLRQRLNIPPRGEWRQRIGQAIDNRVRIITAGLSLKELRAVMRGDPPTEKPNPRYKVITTSFIMHLRPRYYMAASTRFAHTFRLGWFTTFFFLVELFTGVILMVYYVPFPDNAYESILAIESNVFFGELMRDVHRLGAEAMVIFTWLHLFRTYFTGSYKGQRTFTWLTGVLLLFITAWLSFTGYLLTWDQLGYWAITVGSSITDAGPVAGPALNIILRGAPDIGAGGLLRFYLQHVILFPLIAVLLISIHYYKVSREHSISLPASVEEGDLPKEEKKDATKRIDLIPDLLTHELFLASIGIFLTLAILYFGLFDSPLETHANPQKTPLDTKAPWYFWWLQGMLKIDPAQIFENMINPIIGPIGSIFGQTWQVELSKLLDSKFIMGLILPPALVGLLMAVPYIDRNPSRLAKNRKFAIGWGIAWIFILLALSYMGLPEYGIETPAATRIVQDLAPEEGLGPLREIPHEELLSGIYNVEDYDGNDLCPDLVYFGGTLDEVTATSWIVGDQEVLITPETAFHDEIFEGDHIIVQSFLNEENDLEANYIKQADHPEEFVTFGCPHLTEVFNQFSERLMHAEEEGDLPGMEAYLQVEDFQANMKLVIPHVKWLDEDGEVQTYKVDFFLHEDGKREH